MSRATFQPKPQTQQGQPVSRRAQTRSDPSREPVNSDQSHLQNLGQRMALAPNVQRLQSLQAMANTAQSAPIQRAVGFEFETGWYVDRVQQPAVEDVAIEEGDQEDVALGEDVAAAPVAPVLVPLAKKDIITPNGPDGVNVEADEAEAGRSEIEFVVHPPLGETEDGLLQLGTIMGELQTFANNLRARHPDPFLLSVHTGAAQDAGIMVEPRDAEMRAGPQATTGLQFEAIPRFIDEDAAGPGDVTAFQGLATLICGYIERGAGDDPGTMEYPKMIAEPILARTDFHSLVGLLPAEQLLHYRANNALWVTDILAVTGLSAAFADRDMFYRGVVPNQALYIQARQQQGAHAFAEPDLTEYDNQLAAVTFAMGNVPTSGLARFLYRGPSLETLAARQVVLGGRKLARQQEHADWVTRRDQLRDQIENMKQRAGFTVRQWLVGMLAGVDLLTGVADSESMGEMGDRTENVGPDGDQEVGIFEWRQDQTTKIPPNQWGNYALDFMAKVMRLHGHDID